MGRIAGICADMLKGAGLASDLLAEAGDATDVEDPDRDFEASRPIGPHPRLLRRLLAFFVNQ
jgi:hypothetical protein